MVSTESASALEPLAPLVREGYKALATRALDGINAWYSSLDTVSLSLINGKLSTINLPEQMQAKTLYVATGGRVEKRSLSRSLLEDSVSYATKELAALSDEGDAAGINPESFSRLFFAFDSSAFLQAPNKKQIVEKAINMAAGYYSANGRHDFVSQLNTLCQLGGIRMSDLRQGVDYASDGRLSILIFRILDNDPAVHSIIIGLRLLYIAADSALENPADDLSGLRERIMAVAEAKGIASQIPEGYLKDDSHLKSINKLLGGVRLHRGVEALIAGCSNLPSNLMKILLLTKVLDTVNTGKFAIKDGDKPYSDAIGLAELIA